MRIFVGTESGQQRAERVFVWSIEQVRDPSRAVEIHLMRDLEGFDRRRWLTGFTNYRFAIPELAGGSGRAIYNDVDQIYLKDPALLFDLEMAGRGYLSIRATDTSVMLIDCARMASVWTPESVRTPAAQGDRNGLGACWGPLAPEWNARDEEHAPGRTGVLHFTTIHTQPWQPFPERFVYQHNPVGDVWLDLERSANQAGYQIFSAEQPSAGWLALLARLGAAPAAATPAPPEVSEALPKPARTPSSSCRSAALSTWSVRRARAASTGAAPPRGIRRCRRWRRRRPRLSTPSRVTTRSIACPTKTPAGSWPSCSAMRKDSLVATASTHRRR